MPRSANPDGTVKVSIPVTFEVPLARVPADLKARAKKEIRSVSQQVRFELAGFIESKVNAAIGEWLTPTVPAEQSALPETPATGKAK